MPNLMPNYSEAVESTPIPAGEYNARVVGYEIKESAKGDKYISWRLQIFNSEVENTNDRSLFHVTMLSGKGAGILKSFLKACLGHDGSEGFDPENCLGAEVAVYCKDRFDNEGNRRDLPEVKNVRPLN